MLDLLYWIVYNFQLIIINIDFAQVQRLLSIVLEKPPFWNLAKQQFNPDLHIDNQFNCIHVMRARVHIVCLISG